MTNRTKTIKSLLPIISALLLSAALAGPAAAQSVQWEESAKVTYFNERGQYIIYGQYKHYYSVLEEVEIMNFDRSMGIGFVEEISGTFMVVRLLWLKPEFFARDATRVRKVFISPLPTVKKEISYDTPIYFDLEKEMAKDVSQLAVQRVQTTPYGEFYKDSDVITVEPLAEPWKKTKIPPIYGYVIDPDGKVKKLGLQPETSQGTGEEVKSSEKSETTSRRRRTVTKESGEELQEKDDLKEKK